jgi:hypothetical protein
VDRLQRFTRQVTANGQRRGWYLQLDVRNYFPRIDKAILWRLLEPHIADDDARWLTELLVFHDCTEGHIPKDAPGELARVPAHKSLLRCEPDKGLPIGNLNSQFFANVYLNGLDQFVKHALRCRHYLRYCDDFVLLSDDPEQLRDWRVAIAGYLDQALELELNPHQRLRPMSDGVDFLGSGRCQRRQEELPIIVLEEHRGAVDPAQDHVHGKAAGDNAGASGHPSRANDSVEAGQNLAEKRGLSLRYPHKSASTASRHELGAPAFSRLRAPGARCPRRATCGAGARGLPIMRRWTTGPARALVPAQTPPMRHRAATATGRLESRRSQWAARRGDGSACERRLPVGKSS